MGDNARKCKDCPAYERCRDSAISWFFLFVGLIATIAVRLVNIVLDFSLFWAKFFWYLGIAGFFLYFLYKFRQDVFIKKEVARACLAEKLIRRENLSNGDYEFLRTIVCRIRSRKDAVNYFVIFFTSGFVLVVAVLQDFFRK